MDVAARKRSNLDFVSEKSMGMGGKRRRRVKDDVSRFLHQNLVMSRIKIRAYIKTETRPCRGKFARV